MQGQGANSNRSSKGKPRANPQRLKRDSAPAPWALCYKELLARGHLQPGGGPQGLQGGVQAGPLGFAVRLPGGRSLAEAQSKRTTDQGQGGAQALCEPLWGLASTGGACRDLVGINSGTELSRENFPRSSQVGGSGLLGLALRLEDQH